LLVVIFLLYETNDFFLLLVEILYTLFSHSFSGYLSLIPLLPSNYVVNFTKNPSQILHFI